jgi:hypothetical protein
MADSRGSRADVRQGGSGAAGDLPSCHFCGETMLGYQIPDHIRTSHLQGSGLDD